MKGRRTILFSSLVFLSGLTAGFAQGTAFTYQGRLNDNGGPANGVYDFTFQAFDALTNGNSIGGTVNVNAVAATNGLFTAPVDLGGTPFTGQARWLQISVSTNGAGSFITLTPRQSLTPTPYATYANTAATVTNAAIANAQLAANSVATGNIQDGAINAAKIPSGQVVKSLNGLTDAVSLTQGANIIINTTGNSLQISAPAGGLNLPFSGSASSGNSIFTLANSGTGPAGVFLGKVGVGTIAPTHTVHIAAGAPAIALQDTNAASQQAGYVSYRDNGNVERGWVGYGTAGSPDFSVVNARSAGNILLLPFTGNVGINNSAPLAKLDVNGGGLFSGSVGIGTTTPLAKLDVRGDIRLGPSGQFRATSGEENLRILRGRIDKSGNIVLGTGFTVTHPSTGRYTVTFNIPFNGTPVVTAMTHYVVSDATVDWILNSDASSTHVTLLTGKVFDSTVQDVNFDFIAIGPR